LRDPKGEGGEEVEQFLSDIYTEYLNATKDDAPEYFIGTIVVCRTDDEVYDLIDRQQRTTTAYITLCAIRDALRDMNAEEIGDTGLCHDKPTMTGHTPGSLAGARPCRLRQG
jgi:hypothetical protein